jgi:hypothetical protein
MIMSSFRDANSKGTELDNPYDGSAPAGRG